VRSVLGLAAVALLVAAALSVQPAAGSKGMIVGLYDEPETLYGNPDFSFPLLRSLGVRALRLNLYWGGQFGVARRKPFDGADPGDPAYDWRQYDRVIGLAVRSKIKVMLSIYGTPAWANGGKGLNRAPRNFTDLRRFAFAAATRYSGTWTTQEGASLPKVRLWAAWNEPNNPVFLQPQYLRNGGRWVIQSAANYRRICDAVYSGVHSTLLKGQKVACGLTAPRGNNNPGGARASVSPINFLDGLKKMGLRRFDAYAHHPYYTYPGESPSTRPAGPAKSTRITLGNIDVLVDHLRRLYGKRPLWITEYGYQTNPPDQLFGVSWARQATYLSEAFAIARKNPSIDMMLWFLLKDEPILSGWQSGLITSAGKKKPSFAAFKRLAK
jgi:hypothetical protein